MLNKYNYVVLGWNTTSTSFFTTLKTIMLGFSQIGKYVAAIAHKHVADIAKERERLLYLTYMSELA